MEITLEQLLEGKGTRIKNNTPESVKYLVIKSFDTIAYIDDEKPGITKFYDVYNEITVECSIYETDNLTTDLFEDNANYLKKIGWNVDINDINIICSSKYNKRRQPSLPPVVKHIYALKTFRESSLPQQGSKVPQYTPLHACPRHTALPSHELP